MTPYCLALSLVLIASLQETEVARKDISSVIAALHAYELHHGRDDWSWRHLQDARAQVYDPLFAQKQLPQWLDDSYTFALQWFSVFIVIAVIGGTYLAWRLWRAKSTWKALGYSFVWLVVIYLLHWMIVPGQQPIVIIKAEGTLLRQGNGISYPPHTYLGLPIRLAAGVEAQVRAQRSNGWVQILLPGEKIGWVPSDSVYFIK